MMNNNNIEPPIPIKDKGCPVHRFLIGSCTQGVESTTKLVFMQGDHLTLSLIKAQNPTVLKINLVAYDVIRFEVKTDGDQFNLVYYTTINNEGNNEGEKQHIAAQFGVHSDAMDIMHALTCFHQNDTGKTQRSGSNLAVKTQGSRKNLFKAALFIVFIGVLLAVILPLIGVFMKPKSIKIPSDTAAPVSTVGSPVSADDFLKQNLQQDLTGK